MKAALLRELGGPEVLRIEDIPVPTVRDHEVLVKVLAVGVSYHDVVQRNGVMRRHTKLPIILGYEIAGRVEAIGATVTTLKVGDLVCTKAFQSCGMCRYCRTGMETSCTRREAVHGGYAEYVALPEEVCVAFPETLSPAAACMLGASTGVAINAVRDTGQVKLGDRVLVTGASGGVGLSAVAIAHLAGGKRDRCHT